MRRLEERKFLALLLALTLLLVLSPVLHGTFGGRLVFDLFLTVVFIASFQVVFTSRPLRLPALLLGVPIVIGAWTGYVLPDAPRFPLAVGLHLFGFLFLVLTTVTILWSVYEDESVSAESVLGALCGYLLIGLAFGHLYCLVVEIHPGAFRGREDVEAQLRDEVAQHFLLTYYSFSTLTTLGYGDITPASNTTRGLAMVEAIVGQFYIAVLIAELVGKRGSRSSSGQANTSQLNRTPEAQGDP
jgi:hypothetical protein